MQVGLACAVLAASSLAFFFTNAVITRAHETFSEDADYTRGLYRFYLALFTGIATAWLAQPACSELLNRWRTRLSRPERRVLIFVSVILSCALVSGFLIHFGRHQYGGWDYNIFVDVGWRQILGQRPFVDFVTPTPPLFNWTTALAFHCFGVSWNANLYLSALFASGTLVWCFFLLRSLSLSSFAALGTALSIQTAAMLTCCFWWYNNTTLVLAALLYLSALLLARDPRNLLAQISFVFLLGILPLAKPNIAGLAIVGCVALLLLTSEQRIRVVLLVVCGAVFSALLFAALHVSLPAMTATYRGVSQERGALSTFGFHKLSPGEKGMTVFWIALLCVPLLSVLRPFRQELKAHRWRQAALWLFFPLAALVAAFGIAGNGELRDVECTLLIGGLAVLAFAARIQRPSLQRLTVALLVGMACSDLYAGMARLRVYTIGPHVFFEWQNNRHLFTSGFFQDLRGSDTLAETDQQVQEAVKASSGSVFFGPRLDFEYAALGLVSPLHWTVFFEPGTAFSRAETPKLLDAWSNHRFGTLVFLKGDYTLYPAPLLAEIQTRYVRDDQYPRLTVYRRRPGM